MRRRVLVVLMVYSAVVVLALSACSATEDPPEPVGATEPAGISTPSPPPADWRTVVRGGVQVSVPPEFEDGNATQRLTQWCVDRTGPTDQPIVDVTEQVSTLVLCAGGLEAEHKLENTGIVVTIVPATLPDGSPNSIAAEGGDRTVVQIEDMRVVVQAPEPLRSEIARTARLAD